MDRVLVFDAATIRVDTLAGPFVAEIIQVTPYTVDIVMDWIGLRHEATVKATRVTHANIPSLLAKTKPPRHIKPIINYLRGPSWAKIKAHTADSKKPAPPR